MAINLWGVSPLDEFEGLKVGSIPTVTPIDKVLEEGNCWGGDKPWGGSLRMFGEEMSSFLFPSKLRGYETET